MQTKPFTNSRASWSRWADFLRSHGLENLAAWALDAAGPLTPLGAQILYMGSPLLRPSFSDGQLDSLAGLLEDSNEVRAFTAYLREEGPR